MPRIFIGNFDFEHELAAPGSERRGHRESVGRVNAELARAWVAIAERDDVVLAPDRVEPDEFNDLAASGLPIPRFIERPEAAAAIRDLELVPWGWTPRLASLAARRGWRCVVPPLDVVRHVNSRAFRRELESALGVNLPGSAVARSIDELNDLIAAAGDAPLGWLLKSNFGMAGRESVRGRGQALSEPLGKWVQRRMATVGCVVFEPIVDRIAEAGIQIEVPAEGPPLLVGVTPLLVDRAGTYRGSRFGSAEIDAAPWSAAVDVALQVAQRVQRLGYFGPLGIDAMQYRDAGGRTRLRPLQDLNARYTMGRLALGFSRIVPAGWCASWLRGPRRSVAWPGASALGELPVVRDGRARVLATSGGTQGVPGALLVLAESPQVREAVEGALPEPSPTHSGDDAAQNHPKPNA